MLLSLLWRRLDALGHDEDSISNAGDGHAAGDAKDEVEVVPHGLVQPFKEGW